MTTTISDSNLYRQLLSKSLRSLGNLKGRGRIANFLHQQFLSQGSPHIIGQLNNGGKLQFNLNQMQQRMAFYLGNLDSDILKVITQYFLADIADNIFVDVGANVGLYSVQVAVLCPKTKVIAFEPGYKNFQQLEANIALNNLQKNVVLVKKALSCKNTQHTLIYCHKENNYDSANAAIVSDWQHSLDEWKSHKEYSEIIDCVSFDSWFAENSVSGKIGFIKIDVEGHEHEVIQGMKQTLLTHRPGIFTEMNSFFFRMKNTNSLASVNYFAELDYSAYQLNQNKLIKVLQLKENTQNIFWIPNEKSNEQEVIDL
jgi:FkbM family methyltransferase